MNDNHKFVFGIIVTVTVFISLWVVSYNMRPPDPQIIAAPPSNYELCLNAAEVQLKVCEDRRHTSYKSERLLANEQNKACAQIISKSFEECQKFANQEIICDK